MKNYRELCSLLEIKPTKSANSKNAQLNKLRTWLDYEREGHKFIIKEIFTKQKEIKENRGKSKGSRKNNDIYGDLIQLLILDLLAQGNRGEVTLTRNSLLERLNMINHNYRYGNENINSLSDYTKIKKSVLYDFFNTSNSNFKKIIENSLDNLRDKALIIYEKVMSVCVFEVINKHNMKEVYRRASKFEKEYILKCEKEVLKELGYKKISEVRCSSDWHKFKNKVKELLHNDSNINFYYTSYKITVNYDYLQEECTELIDLLLNNLKRNEYKTELNSKVITHFLKNAEKRHKKPTGKMALTRSMSTYVKENEKLTDLLISSDANNLKESIEDYKELHKSLDDLFG